MSSFLPFSLPIVCEEEINEVTDTLRSGWLTSRPKTAQFEKGFSEFIEDPPIAFDAFNRAVSLAIHPKINNGDVKRVTFTITKILAFEHTK